MNDNRWTTFTHHCLIERNRICITSVPIYRRHDSCYRYATTRMPILPKHRRYFCRKGIWRFRI